MKFEIKHRVNGSVLFEGESGSLKLCVEAAINAKADLSGANLSRANLSGANLSGATYNGHSMTKPPIMISGLTWYATILDTHMKIGCELHSFAEWEGFDDERIDEMAGRALEFWRVWKTPLLSMAKAAGRSW